MEFQEKIFSCGAACVVNVMRLRGRRIGEKRVRQLAETSVDGTDEHGIRRALEALSVGSHFIEERGFKKAYQLLCEALRQGQMAIVYFPRIQHWVLAFGLLEDRRVIIFDPEKPARRRSGVSVLHPQRLNVKWKSKNGDPYFFIACHRSPGVS